MAEFYAVKVGRKPGIYTSWKLCQKQIHKFSGAKYKSFGTLEEAETFVSNKCEITPSISKSSSKEKKIRGSKKLSIQKIMDQYPPMSQSYNTFSVVDQKERLGRHLVMVEHICGAKSTMSESAYNKSPVCFQCTLKEIKNIEVLQRKITSILGKEYVLLNNELPKNIGQMVLRIKHIVCGQLYLIKIKRFLKYQEGCPCLTASNGERQVAEYLKSKMIKYHPEYIIKAKSIYDFAVLSGNRIIANCKCKLNTLVK